MLMKLQFEPEAGEINHKRVKTENLQFAFHLQLFTINDEKRR